MKLLGPDDNPMALADVPNILKRLRCATDDALAKIGELKCERTWTTPWCYQAEHYETDDSNAGWRVWICKAAPESQDLQAHVRLELEAHGWPGVEVVTEW